MKIIKTISTIKTTDNNELIKLSDKLEKCFIDVNDPEYVESDEEDSEKILKE